MDRRRTLSEYRTKKIVPGFAIVTIGTTALSVGGTVEAWVKATLAVVIALTLVWVVIRPRRWNIDDRAPTR